LLKTGFYMSDNETVRGSQEAGQTGSGAAQEVVGDAHQPTDSNTTQQGDQQLNTPSNTAPATSDVASKADIGALEQKLNDFTQQLSTQLTERLEARKQETQPVQQPAQQPVQQPVQQPDMMKQAREQLENMTKMQEMTGQLLQERLKAANVTPGSEEGKSFLSKWGNPTPADLVDAVMLKHQYDQAQAKNQTVTLGNSPANSAGAALDPRVRNYLQRKFDVLPGHKQGMEASDSEKFLIQSRNNARRAHDRMRQMGLQSK
jgi:hypothetical protein